MKPLFSVCGGTGIRFVAARIALAFDRRQDGHERALRRRQNNQWIGDFVVHAYEW